MTNGKSSPRVAVIDDIPGTRMVVRDMLSEMGFENVVEFSDGTDALEGFKKAPPELIICDHNLTTMSGLELLERIEKDAALKRVPFIMISGHSSMQKIEEAIERGALTYIFKPIDYLTLRNTVISALKDRWESPGKV